MLLIGNFGERSEILKQNQAGSTDANLVASTKTYCAHHIEELLKAQSAVPCLATFSILVNASLQQSVVMPDPADIWREKHKK